MRHLSLFFLTVSLTLFACGTDSAIELESAVGGKADQAAYGPFALEWDGSEYFSFHCDDDPCAVIISAVLQREVTEYSPFAMQFTVYGPGGESLDTQLIDKLVPAAVYRNPAAPPGSYRLVLHNRIPETLELTVAAQFGQQCTTGELVASGENCSLDDGGFDNNTAAECSEGECVDGQCMIPDPEWLVCP